MGSVDELHLSVSPSDVMYARHQPQWAREAHDLRKALERDVREAVVPVAPGDGAKGLELAEVLMTISSAGAFTAAVEAFRAWLGSKPRQRELNIDYVIGGRTGSIKIDSTNTDAGELARVVSDVLDGRDW